MCRTTDERRERNRRNSGRQGERRETDEGTGVGWAREGDRRGVSRVQEAQRERERERERENGRAWKRTAQRTRCAWKRAAQRRRVFEHRHRITVENAAQTGRRQHREGGKGRTKGRPPALESYRQLRPGSSSNCRATPRNGAQSRTYARGKDGERVLKIRRSELRVPRREFAEQREPRVAVVRIPLHILIQTLETLRKIPTRLRAVCKLAPDREQSIRKSRALRAACAGDAVQRICRRGRSVWRRPSCGRGRGRGIRCNLRNRIHR